MLCCRYVDLQSWTEIHNKSDMFKRVFEPSRVQRVAKDIKTWQMTEAGYGFMQR